MKSTKSRKSAVQSVQEKLPLEQLLPKLAAEGNSLAQGALAQFYIAGEGTPAQRTEAVKWCRKAAEQGEVDAQNAMGAGYAVGDALPQDFTEAVKWFRLAAEQGHTEGQIGLGLAYLKGDGIPSDQTQAVQWWQTAAESGSSKAQYLLGKLYGIRGSLCNFTEAARWYRKAADQGHPRAHYEIALLYQEGSGVTQDSVEAYVCMKVAASMGCDEGQTIWNGLPSATHLDRFSKKMTPAQITEAHKLSRALLGNLAL